MDQICLQQIQDGGWPPFVHMIYHPDTDKFLQWLYTWTLCTTLPVFCCPYSVSQVDMTLCWDPGLSFVLYVCCGAIILKNIRLADSIQHAWSKIKWTTQNQPSNTSNWSCQSTWTCHLLTQKSTTNHRRLITTHCRFKAFTTTFDSDSFLHESSAVHWVIFTRCGGGVA